jgi:flagellar hook-length control protein FliK
VRLSPADLGTIEIELDVSDQSEIHARIAADDPRTLAMLKQDAPLIRQALEQTGLSTNSDSLNFSLRQDGQSNNRQNPEDRSGSPSKLREQDLFSDPGHDGRPAPTPLRRVTSLLDMNI